RALSRARVPIAIVVATIAIAGSMSVFVQPRALGAVARTLTVTPSTGLTDQAVQGNWAGFTPTTPEGLNQVVIVQRGPRPASMADCYTEQPFPSSANGNEIVDGVTLADGTGHDLFEVRPAAQLPQLGCSAAQPCTLLAFENQVIPDGQLPTN